VERGIPKKSRKKRLSCNHRGFTFSAKKTEIGDTKKKLEKKGKPVTIGLTSTKKKVRRVLARKSLPRTKQNSPSAFSHQIRNNSKKDKTKTSQMMGWIENRPNKFLNQNFVRQGLPAKCKSVRFRLISLPTLFGLCQ